MISESVEEVKELQPGSSKSQLSPADSCAVCEQGIHGEHVVNNQTLYHSHCFLCHQCLRPFPQGVFFEKEGKLYCDDDYLLLHGSRCGRCGDLIRGKCITALGTTWHEEHLSCEACGKSLAGTAFMNKEGVPYCKPCYHAVKLKEAEAAMDFCEKCNKPITDNGQLVLMRGSKYHCSHFQCSYCQESLLAGKWKEHLNKLYCVRDYERILNGLGICFSCHTPIFGRSLTALGKIFHPEHFVCFKCEKPFAQDFFWEYENKAFCEYHFNERKGTLCTACYEPVSGQVRKINGRVMCGSHGRCQGCHAILGDRAKSAFFDYKFLCEACFEYLPMSTRNNILAEMKGSSEK